MNIETETIPPETFEDSGGGDDVNTNVQIRILEDDGTFRTAEVFVESTDDDVIADGLVECLKGVAAMRGTGLQWAVSKRLT